jgi:hypothetical protein
MAQVKVKYHVDGSFVTDIATALSATAAEQLVIDDKTAIDVNEQRAWVERGGDGFVRFYVRQLGHHSTHQTTLRMVAKMPFADLLAQLS